MNERQKFLGFIDAVPQIIWTADADGTIDYVNQALITYTGLAPTTPSDINWLDAVHPEDKGRCINAWQASVRTGSQYFTEFRLYRATDQTYRWHLGQALPIHDRQGKVNKWYGTLTDIHERKVMEKDIKQLADHLKSALESITDAFMTLDSRWQITYVNEGVAKILGQTGTDLLGKSLWEKFPDFNISHIEKKLQEAAAQQCVVELEAFHAGLEKWFAIRAYPMQGGLTLYLRDITDQKAVQEAIRLNQERFENIANATLDAIWDWNLITDEVWGNKGYESLTGFGVSQSLFNSRSGTEFIHAEDKERVLQGLQAVIQGTGDTWSDAYRLRRQDGSYAYVKDCGIVIRDHTGKAIRMVGGMMDLTSQKSTELNLAKVNCALRMLSAANKALIHAEDEHSLLTEICRIAVSVGGYRMAWVGYTSADENSHVIPMAYAGQIEERNYLENLRVSLSEDNPRGKGPGGQSLRTGKPMVCPDISNDPNFSIWKNAAERNGLRGLICLPLRWGQHVFGLLNLYSSEVLGINNEEIQSLQDLANNLAFGINSLQSQKRRQQIESAVLKVASAVSASAGEEFFEQLALNMTDALGAQGGFIARFLPEKPFIVRTICAVTDGKTVENFEYDIEGTPCERFNTDSYCIVRENVSSLFPKSFRLASFRAQAYVGRRLDDSKGKPIGLLYVLFRQPLKEVDFITSTIQIFAARAAAELERYENDARIRSQAALLDKTQDAVIVCDVNHHILFWNKGAERLYGWTADEALGKAKGNLLRADSVKDQQATETVLTTGEWSGLVSYGRKDGSTVLVEAHWSLVNNDEGRAQSIFTINTDVTQRKAYEREIQQLAFYDTLTGLPNRRLLHERLQKSLLDCARHHRVGALLFIDLDNFKAINDTVGHDKGDLLLQQVAARLKSCTRKNNTVARLGGDEFVIILDDLDKSEVHAAHLAEAVAEKILEIFRLPFKLDDVEHRSTPSIGIALYNHEINSMDELLKRADLAMYEAKAAGRNAIRFFDPNMQKVINARVKLESELRKGLHQKGFVLHYQAQADSEGRLTGTEALIRWWHPVQGNISPAEFIPLAEDTGLIVPLGEWVLESACAQLAKWAKEPATANLSIAVNISSRHFRHPTFVQQVMSALERNGANPSRLKLELTESLLINDMESVIDKMNALKSEGVSFSLDDFGTGYSSLSYLKRLPLDQLKIDQSFVHDVLNDVNDAAIAKTIVALAHSLGLSVIAEGVETVEQRDFLAENGCHAYQGYLYGRPLSIEQFEDTLLRNSQPLSDGRTRAAGSLH